MGTIHYRYVIGILIFLIIEIITVAFFDIPDLVNRISFALTLSSLVLAILAIFYAIITDQKQSQHFSSLVQTQSSIEKSATEIRNVSSTIESSLKKEIPSNFEKMHGEFKTLKTMISGPIANQNSNLDNGEQIFQNKKAFTIFFTSLPFISMICLYYYVKTYYLKKPFYLSVFENLKIGNISFTGSFFVTIKSAQVVNFSIDDSTGQISHITCPEIVSELTPFLIDEIMKVSDKNIIKDLITMKSIIDNHISTFDN